MTKGKGKGGGSGVETGKSIEGFAEDLGRLLGQARNKAEGWLSQRTVIVKQLTRLRDEASTLLSQLGHAAQSIAHPGRPAGGKHAAKHGLGRPKGSGKRKRKPMSAEARAKISAAQKRRWAKQKAAGKK